MLKHLLSLGLYVCFSSSMGSSLVPVSVDGLSRSLSKSENFAYKHFFHEVLKHRCKCFDQDNKYFQKVLKMLTSSSALVVAPSLGPVHITLTLIYCGTHYFLHQ